MKSERWKPIRFDLSDERIKTVFDRARAEVQLVYGAAEPLGRSVVPVYAFRDPVALVRGREKPRQFGSGVLVRLVGESFLLSAAHVFEEFGDWSVLIGCGESLVPLLGTRFSSLPGPSGSHQDDPIDAAVLHIEDPSAIPPDLFLSAMA